MASPVRVPLLIIFFFCFAKSGISQKIETDRPDQSDGISIIKKQDWQLESSVYFTHYDSARQSVISSSLFRYGVTKNMELRLLVEQGHNRNQFMEETAQSQFPLAFSVKRQLLAETDKRPGIGLVGYLQVPVTNASRTHQWSPALILIAEKEFSPLTLTINTGVKQETFNPDWEMQLTADLKLELSKRFQLFGEYFAQYSASLPFHNVDAGILFQADKHWMFYAAAGSSVEHRPHNSFVNTGFAFRY